MHSPINIRFNEIQSVTMVNQAPPGTTSSSITTHTPSGQRNYASWASQPQKSVIFLPCPGGRITKSTKDMWWHWKEKKKHGESLFGHEGQIRRHNVCGPNCL